MTISTTTNRVTYTGNGVTVAFSFPYAFFAQADLVVIETIIATGVQTTKALTTDYTISGSVDTLGHYSSGGTVTAVTAPASTVTWTIYRDPTATQTTDLVENDPMPAESIEAALDYQTMLNQRTRDIAARSLQQPEGDSATIGRLPAKVDRASRYLTFDSDGNPATADPVLSTAVPDLEWVLKLTDFASLTAAVAYAGSTVYTLLITEGSTVSANVTVPSTLTLWFLGQGKLTVDSGKTVTINGPLVSFDGRVIFAGAGTVTVTSDQNFTQNGALIHRFVDRVLVGGAATNDGAFPNVTQDWLTQFQITTGLTSGSIVNAATGSLTNTAASSAFGGVFGSQSSAFTSASTSCIGVMGIAVNNNTTYATRCWGGYFEAHKVHGTTGTGCRGVEIDVRVETGVSEIDPLPGAQTQSSCLQLGAGAGVPTTGNSKNVGAAIQIVGNGTYFRKGIVFLKDALEGTDGTSGAGVALALSTFHALSWYNTSGGLCGRITTTNTGVSNKTEVRFSSTGVQFLGESGQALGYWFNVASAVNYPTLNASVTGSPIILAAAGTDTNIDLQLTTKGTGVVRFGTHAAITTETLSGYITIKDAGGTSRKVAVVS